MRYVFCILLSALMALALTAVCQQDSESPIINLMIITDSPPEEQMNATTIDLRNLWGEISKRDITATLFLTQDVAGGDARVFLAQLGNLGNVELAMSGIKSDELLSNGSYSEQKNILIKSKEIVENCRICGQNEIIATGFMPPSFDQNKDTLKVLDDLGILYDSGYQASIIYEQGHEKDVWPYKVEDHKFYAVPVSSYESNGEIVPLVDKYLKQKGYSSSQWYDVLTGKLDEIAERKEPMVLVVSTELSGSGEWLDTLSKFLDYGMSKNSMFVTTMDLVNVTLPEGNIQKSISSSKSECTTCGAKSGASIGNGTQDSNKTVMINMTM